MEEEKSTILSRFDALKADGKTKKAAIELMGLEFGRGPWSLERILKNRNA
jgi:site-specific DNA-methyltransferase (adenine-specific)